MSWLVPVGARLPEASCCPYEIHLLDDLPPLMFSSASVRRRLVYACELGELLLANGDSAIQEMDVLIEVSMGYQAGFN